MATITARNPPTAVELNVLARKQRSLWLDAWHRLTRNKMAMAGLVVVVLALLLALFAPWIAPKDPSAQNPAQSLADPFWGNPQFTNPAYPLGSDTLGRDILSRLIWSSRVSMLVGFVPVTIIFVMGVSIGMYAAYFGGWVDNLLMRLTDVMYAFPDLLFLIIIFATLRNTWAGDLMGGLVLMFAGIAIVNWVGMARLVRGQVLSLKEKEFIEAARATGARPGRIMLRHLFPNALAPVIVSVAFAIPSAMLAEATLSFLGFGIKPPTPTWGVMILEGFVHVTSTPWPVLLPAFCIAIVMLAFTFLGDGLRDALDPRMKL